MLGPEIERLIQLLAKLPGLGPRSARRAVLHLLARKDGLMAPLAAALGEAAARITACATCGNLDTADPCGVCADPRRDDTMICVVEGVADLWALERAAAFNGRYHVLGGTLSPLDGIGPDELNIDGLIRRVGVAGQAGRFQFVKNLLAELTSVVTFFADSKTVGLVQLAEIRLCTHFFKLGFSFN